MAYLTTEELFSRSAWEQSDWEEFFGRPNRANTFRDWERGIRARDIDAPLRLRYAVPFGVPVGEEEPDPELTPECVKDWMAALFDERLARARRMPGENAGNAEDGDLQRESQRVRDEIAGAADQDRPAHHELPLRSDTNASGVAKGRPLSVGHNSVYGFFDSVARRRDETGW